MMFKHIPYRLPRIKTRNRNGKRFYMVTPSKLYPSVTTVTGLLSQKGIEEWRQKVGDGYADAVQVRAITLGSELHKVVEIYMNNKDPFKDHKNIIVRAHFENIKPHIDRINNIRCQEGALFSHDLKLAGRVDCVAEFDGKLSIIDFKTSTKKKREDWIEQYFLQETAYAMMWSEMTTMPINQIVTIISGEDGSSEVFVKNSADYKIKLREIIKKYEELNKGKEDEKT